MNIHSKIRFLSGHWAIFSLIFLVSGMQPIQATKQQEDAALALVKRIIPKEAGNFTVTILEKEGEKDFFELDSENGRINLKGTNGVAVASALNYYLTNYAHCQITWNGTNLHLPNPLPVVPEKIHKETPYKYRYYLNYCTFNYSMSWWDWDRWQKEIDYMALKGINMPLALTGQNIIWNRVYKKMGFSRNELSTFFSGPAYFSWFWMGNLDGWGGPLSENWMKSHEMLQKKILAQERALGMTPVLPAFTGHVPPTFKDKFPQASLKKTNWLDYPPVYILDPKDPMFEKIGTEFIKEETRIYGTDHLYSSDTFNENLPPTNDSTYLNDVSKKLYQSMTKADPKATWVMQGWLFSYQSDFWKAPQIKAILNAVPNDRMIILDLWSENHPMWKKTDAYFGKSWIWCMLHNFGGNVCMFGKMDEIAKDPATALKDPASGNLLGLGLTPEAIEQNPVIYELMLENIWRDSPINVNSWLENYVNCRYGKTNKEALAAWKILKETAYAEKNLDGGPQSIITFRPTFDKGVNRKSSYRSEDLLPAWRSMIKASAELKGSDGFQYDIVDLTRQVLVNYADTLQSMFSEAYARKDMDQFAQQTNDFLNLLDDLDLLLATRKDFSLGPWIAAAKKCASNKEEAILYEQNARDQLTLWGGEESVLHDYASKQWSGLIKDFYKTRWQLFFTATSQAAKQKEEPDYANITRQIKSFEWKWVNQTEPVYPENAQGNSTEMAVKLYEKYKSVLEKLYPMSL